MKKDKINELIFEISNVEIAAKGFWVWEGWVYYSHEINILPIIYHKMHDAGVKDYYLSGHSMIVTDQSLVLYFGLDNDRIRLSLRERERNISSRMLKVIVKFPSEYKLIGTRCGYDWTYDADGGCFDIADQYDMSLYVLLSDNYGANDEKR